MIDTDQEWLLQRDRKRRLQRVFVLLLVLVCVTPFLYPYLSLRLYPLFILNTLPLPQSSQQIDDAYRVQAQCHRTQISRLYITELSDSVVMTFFLMYFNNLPSWGVTQGGVEYLTVARTRSSWINQNQRLSLSVYFFQQAGDHLDPEVATAVRQALAEGKTVYNLSLTYINDAASFRYSECFSD